MGKRDELFVIILDIDRVFSIEELSVTNQTVEIAAETVPVEPESQGPGEDPASTTPAE